MGILNKYKVIIAVVLPILILVLIHSFGQNHFKGDARKWAEPSVLRTNTISGDQVRAMSGEKLIIMMGDAEPGIKGLSMNSLNIPADSILSKKNIYTIRKHIGPVLLLSTNKTVAIRVWMVLSQLGMKNIYIVTDSTDNEISKYKFRPDSLVRPEL